MYLSEKHGDFQLQLTAVAAHATVASVLCLSLR